MGVFGIRLPDFRSGEAALSIDYPQSHPYPHPHSSSSPSSSSRSPLTSHHSPFTLTLQVRAALGIDATEYAHAFSAVQELISEYGDAEKKYGFREIISSGASGSYFYFTPDRRYVVKTVSKPEKATLLRIAPYYLEHCRAHPSTMIKYLGCHSIRLPLNTCKVRVGMRVTVRVTVIATVRVRGAPPCPLLSPCHELY